MAYDMRSACHALDSMWHIVRSVKHIRTHLSSAVKTSLELAWVRTGGGDGDIGGLLFTKGFMIVTGQTAVVIHVLNAEHARVDEDL